MVDRSGGSPSLPAEWEQCLAAVLREQDNPAAALSEEQWLGVLQTVLARMEAIGFVLYLGWQAQLATIAGRSAGQPRDQDLTMVRDRRLLFIGAAGGLVGLLVTSFAPLDDIGPLNQWLVGVIAACGTMWVGLVGTEGASSDA